MSEEVYQYFYFFNLLNKNDLKKAIETEFESYCSDKNFNRNALETRYALVEDLQDKEKIKAIYISVNKAEINRKLQEFDGNAVSTITSLPMAITNVIDANQKENVAIINIEENTTITTVLEQKIYNVDRVDTGMETILNSISEKENSYSKAYEICKNTTIYTMEGKELIQEEENQYLEDIMPTLYNIVQEVKNIVDNSLNRIDKIYITGTGSVINNIDLYFQEYFTNIKCEILKPFFIPENVKINIKDYIEVNSAIAIALMGLGEGIEGMNFKKNTLMEQLKAIFAIEIGGKKSEKTGKIKGKTNIKLQNMFKNDLNQPLDKIEKGLLNAVAGLVILFVVYSGFSMVLKKEFNKKTEEVSQSIQNTNKQIEDIKQDSSNIKQQKDIYIDYIEELEKTAKIAQEKNKTKGAYPNLLNQLMNVIPTNVQIKSIEDKGDGNIEILVQSPKYEQIAFFIGSIKTEVILTNVISTSGQRSSDVITVKIEGELP